MVSMYRENWDCNIDVRILIVDVIECPAFSSAQLVFPSISILLAPSYGGLTHQNTRSYLPHILLRTACLLDSTSSSFS